MEWKLTEKSESSLIHNESTQRSARDEKLSLALSKGHMDIMIYESISRQVVQHKNKARKLLYRLAAASWTKLKACAVFNVQQTSFNHD